MHWVILNSDWYEWESLCVCVSVCVCVWSRNGFFHFCMVQNKIEYKYFMTGKPVSMCHAADVIPKQSTWRAVEFPFIFLYWEHFVTVLVPLMTLRLCKCCKSEENRGRELLCSTASPSKQCVLSAPACPLLCTSNQMKVNFVLIN